MPEITEEEFKEYLALKRKDKIRREQVDAMIRDGAPSVQKWREDLNTTRGFAAVFAKVLNKEWERRSQPDSFVLDRLKRVMKYLSDDLIIIEKGRFNIQKYFRECLREYGWAVRIDNRHGLFEVFKI